VNVVRLVGNLGTDPELRVLGDRRRVCSFTLDIVRPGGGGADVLNVVATDSQADRCARLLKRGKSVAVDGRLRSRMWSDDEGRFLSTVEVVASSIRILSSAAARAA